MKGKNREKKQSCRPMWILSGILAAVSALVIYRTNRAVPFMMDDLWYSTMLSDDTPIASFTDIVKSQIWHYYHWGGRSMTHGILQLTLLAGEHWADILNTAVTLLLGGMVCLVSGNRKLPAFFAALGMLIGLNANWRMSMFWQAGAANYLYISVFILAFAGCYLRELPDAENRECGKKNLPGIIFWIIPLGVLTGWSNENMGPAMWVLSGTVILLAWKEKRKIRPWMVLGNLACLAGSAVCILAPGNFVRSAQADEAQYGLLWRLFLRCYGESKGALEYLFPVLLVLFFLWMLYGRRPGRRNELLLFCALLSWGAFLLSPHYPDRASFGTMLLCICVILSLTKRVVQYRRGLAWPLWGMAALIWLRGMYFCGEFLAISWGWIR
ncbi:MAG: DUF6056 family protein [Acetatifactor muris]|nr:DUF6056 family protein [Acetatifactor muris]